jgi:hypothetical protein
MPRWISRIVWGLRGRRLVRLHLTGTDPTIEGILVGRWGGHYVLLKPKVMQEKDRTYTLEGYVEVPADRVVFVQVIGR